MRVKAFGLLALFVVLFCSVSIALSQSVYPPLLITNCEGRFTVRNLSANSVWMRTGYAGVQTPIYDGYLDGYGIFIAMVPYGPYNQIYFQSGFTFTQQASALSCSDLQSVVYDGSVIGYNPVQVPPVYTSVFSPTTCTDGSYQGFLPMLPVSARQYPAGSPVSVTLTDGPAARTLTSQTDYVGVINSGKVDVLGGCFTRAAITSWAHPVTGVIYSISGWYRVDVNGQKAVVYGLLSGKTRQVVVVWYDKNYLTPDPLTQAIIAY